MYTPSPGEKCLRAVGLSFPFGGVDGVGVGVDVGVVSLGVCPTRYSKQQRAVGRVFFYRFCWFVLLIGVLRDTAFGSVAKCKITILKPTNVVTPRPNPTSDKISYKRPK